MKKELEKLQREARNKVFHKLLNLEHGMREFHGMWVFEATEEDELAELLDTLITTAYTTGRTTALEEVEKRLPKEAKANGTVWIDGREADLKLHSDIQVGHNSCLSQIKDIITKLKD